MATSATSVTTSTNLDVNSIVSQLMTVERQPITKLNVKEASYQAKLTAYGGVKGGSSQFSIRRAELEQFQQVSSGQGYPFWRYRFFRFRQQHCRHR